LPILFASFQRGLIAHYYSPLSNDLKSIQNYYSPHLLELGKFHQILSRVFSNEMVGEDFKIVIRQEPQVGRIISVLEISSYSNLFPGLVISVDYGRDLTKYFVSEAEKNWNQNILPAMQYFIMERGPNRILIFTKMADLYPKKRTKNLLQQTHL
jgi:hypothetical protein